MPPPRDSSMISRRQNQQSNHIYAHGILSENGKHVYFVYAMTQGVSPRITGNKAMLLSGSWTTSPPFASSQCLDFTAARPVTPLIAERQPIIPRIRFSPAHYPQIVFYR